MSSRPRILAHSLLTPTCQRCSSAALAATTLGLASVCLLTLSGTALGQDKDTSTQYTTTRRHTTTTVTTTVARESARREALALDADTHIARGDAARELKDYDTAAKEYKLAVDSLTDSPSGGAKRVSALEKFIDVSLDLAKQRITEGRYADAEATLRIVLRPQYAPDNPVVLRLLTRLDDPEYYNQTVTPGFIDKVKQVERYFIEAQGFFDTARYDLAFKRCEQILAIDKTNTAARKLEERIDQARFKFDEHAYDEARARALEETQRGWARPTRRFDNLGDPHASGRVQRDEAGSTVATNNKLRAIIIPNIEFRQTTIRDAIEFLRQQAKQLDPTGEGLNIVLRLSAPGSRAPGTTTTSPAADSAIPGTEAAAAPQAPVATADTRISLSLSRIPLDAALRYVAQQAGLKVKIEPYAVSIVPVSEDTTSLIQAEFKVPPGLFGSSVGSFGASALSQGASSATGGGGGGAGGIGGATRDVSGAGSSVIQRADAHKFLEDSGVTFPNGASATYVAAGSRLVVRNTQENIDLIEAIITNNTPQVFKQIEIESKFVEITQANLKELSFAVNLGTSNIPGSKKLFVTGGSNVLPGITTPTDAQNVNVNTRSGSFGIQGNAIDALLAGTTGGMANTSSVLNLAGVLTDPQFQIAVRALNQMKGTDLLSAPRVTTKSGQKAVIEIIREFIYPTQFQPPQIPSTFGNQGTSVISATGGGSSTGGAFPVTPTTPTSFEKRNTGVTLDVEPIIGPDGYTIDLTLSPQVVDFDGFINYGSPIATVSTNLGISTRTVLTDNVINQPIFSVRKVTTSVSVYDGSTVILGGLTREDVQKVNDKVPVLGDIPLVGRLFRSKIDQNIKRNLIIFVTARLIDPAGQPINSTEEEEEVVKPLTGPEDFVQPPTLPLFPGKK